MREIFDNVYESLLEFAEEFKYFGATIITGFVYVTIPIWVIPYAIYKKKKGGKE